MRSGRIWIGIGNACRHKDRDIIILKNAQMLHRHRGEKTKRIVCIVCAGKQTADIFFGIGMIEVF